MRLHSIGAVELEAAGAGDWTPGDRVAVAVAGAAAAAVAGGAAAVAVAAAAVAAFEQSVLDWV